MWTQDSPSLDLKTEANLCLHLTGNDLKPQLLHLPVNTIILDSNSQIYFMTFLRNTSKNPSTQDKSRNCSYVHNTFFRNITLIFSFSLEEQ